MSTPAAIKADGPPVASRLPAGPATDRVRGWGTAFLAVLAGFAGIGIGVGLTYAFVIIPRARELRVAGVGPDFFRAFDPRSPIEELAAEVSSRRAKTVWNSSAVEPRGSAGENRVRFVKYQEATITLEPAERLEFQNKLGGHLTQTFSKVGIQVSGLEAGLDPSSVPEHLRMDYSGRGASGFILIWCVPRGRDLRVIFVMVEN